MNTLKNSDWLSITGRLGFIRLALILAALSPSAHAAQSVSLAWDPSPGTNVSGYIVHYGQVSGSLTNTVDVGRPTTNIVSSLQEAKTYFFFVTAYNASRVESVPSNLINYTVPGTNGPPTPVYLSFEAESGTLLAPMAIASDQNASGGKYISAASNESGKATLAVDIPASGEYVVWCRVLSSGQATDSLYVSADNGPEDIYDTVVGTWTNAWQWTVLNGRGGTNAPYTSALAINPRTFQFGAGRHNIAFRGREAGTALDQILITNDRNFVPDVVFTITTPNVSMSSIVLDRAGFVTLTWPTVPGKTYRVVYKTKLTDPNWTALSPDVFSAGTTAMRSDYVVGNRFYGVVQLP